MNIIIAGLSLLALSLPSQGSARPYLQTLIKEHGLAKTAASPIWRRYFPASQAVPSSLNDFISDQLRTEGVAELEDEVLAQRVEELRTQWLKDFYPEPSEARVLEVLSEDAELRALMVAFFIAHALVRQQRVAISLPQIFSQSFGVAMFVRAIDSEELEGEELWRKLNNFIANNTLEFSYVGDGNVPHVPGRQQIFYTGREDYLLRENHVKHSSLSGEMLSALWARGYTDRELTATIPPQVANMLLEQNVLPDEDGFFSGHEPSFYFDLLLEPGIIGNFRPTVYEVEASIPDLSEIVALELGVEADSDSFEEFVNLLDDQKNSASLVQVTELKRRGYSLAELSEMTYPTREAIIASGDHSSEAFADQHGTDIRALNETVAKTGELVFYLLQQGYVRNIEDIAPHHAPSHAIMQQAQAENEMWSMWTGPGKFMIVRPEQLQQN